MTPSPPRITKLEPHEHFVYGSNEAGIHGAGAAKHALQFGAKMGVTGLMGQTYGISTKDESIQTLPLDKIHDYVREFLYEAETRPQLVFLVTEIGCGLAGLTPEQIAPMFRGASSNVHLPQRFIDVLTR
jgi:hypothetical protein